MATQVDLYNRALRHLGATRLDVSTGLTEERPDRYELDASYPGVKQAMLERGIWRFALRTVEATADPDVDPNFGLRYAFALPPDYVRFRAIATDADLTSEDRSYRVEAGVLYSEQSTLYLCYVSNGASYGFNLAMFPEAYAEAFGAELAARACVPITKDQNLEAKLFRKSRYLLNEAKRFDAVEERVKEKPLGSWAQSRMVNNSSMRRAGG